MEALGRPTWRSEGDWESIGTAPAPPPEADFFERVREQTIIRERDAAGGIDRIDRASGSCAGIGVCARAPVANAPQPTSLSFFLTDPRRREPFSRYLGHLHIVCVQIEKFAFDSFAILFVPSFRPKISFFFRSMSFSRTPVLSL